MEVIQLAGYTAEEKHHIARRYLIPRQIERNGLKPSQIEITDDAIDVVIDEYTREAGVRNLERELGSICRKVAREVAEGKAKRKVIVDADEGARAARQAQVLLRGQAPHERAGRRDGPRLDAGRRRGAVRRGDRLPGQRQARRSRASSAT